MSLKPIQPGNFTENDVDPGAGKVIPNDARSMRRYGASGGRPADGRPHASHGSHAAQDPSSTGGMRTYASHSHDGQGRKKGNVAVVALVAVLVLAVAVGGALVFLNWADTSDVQDGRTGSVTVTIPNGYGSGDIAQLLKEKGVISSTTDFMQAVKVQQAASSLKAGVYEFDYGMSDEDIVDALVKGSSQSGVTLTVPEGLTVAQTAQRVADAFPNISYDGFMEQAKASRYVGEFTFLNGAYDDSLEGFLFPKTYSLEEGATADDVIRAMLRQFSTETSSLDWAAATQGGVTLTQYQVVVMASLIERETAVESERPLVASVIYNRLNSGMLLQIDASVAYALGKYDVLTYDDLAVDSPYNLYTNYGLCPGPICSPSLSSIQAALNAETTDYVYYVASAALDGTHVFCATAEEFEEAAAAYHAASGTA